MYDEDLSKFEEIVNKKIGLIEKQAEEENLSCVCQLLLQRDS